MLKLIDYLIEILFLSGSWSVSCPVNGIRQGFSGFVDGNPMPVCQNLGKNNLDEYVI